jgi:predicted dehydrogenase
MNHPRQRREFLHEACAGLLTGALTHELATAQEKSSAPRIKLGQIGVGHGHAAKLAIYRESPDYEVVGIVEPDPELRQRAQTQRAYQGLPWMTQDQLLNVPGLQAVLVETRVRDLLNAAEACVAAGKHVHLDKPAGESLPQFKRILNAARAKKLLVQLGYVYRYSPAIVLLRDFVKKGWLGEVFELHGVISKVIPSEGRRELARYRGGTMFELGGHVIDVIVAIMGKPDAVTAYPMHSSRLDDGLNDNVLAVLTYPRATATVRSSALEVEGFDRRHLVVCGTEGTFHVQPLDNPSARVALATARGEYRKGYQDVQFPKHARYVADAAEMASVIRGEKSADFSYEHDLAVQETLLKASALGVE